MCSNRAHTREGWRIFPPEPRGSLQIEKIGHLEMRAAQGAQNLQVCVGRVTRGPNHEVAAAALTYTTAGAAKPSTDRYC